MRRTNQRRPVRVGAVTPIVPGECEYYGLKRVSIFSIFRKEAKHNLERNHLGTGRRVDREQPWFLTRGEGREWREQYRKEASRRREPC